jgi:Ala-tRNA(Pro) deacylase
MPIERLKDFLDSNGVKYVTIAHSPAYTANEIAFSAHIPNNSLAKTVMISLDGRLLMAVVPGSMHVNLSRLRELTGGSDIAVASESEFRRFFPDCETGAMPPFGTLYNIHVYVDELLAGDDIVFNSGSHRELVKMSYKDFLRLVKPIQGRFAAAPEHVWASAS